MSEKLNVYPNQHFYSLDGKFEMEVARDAYIEMMNFYHYPIPPRFDTEDFWVKDFNIGNFAESGMAGIFWLSDSAYNISGHEIFLLPNQSIPEHWHIATEDTSEKLEGWHVRHGSVYTYSEGEPTEGAEDDIPTSHKECTVALKREEVLPGNIALLSAPGERHWMRAGPQGAIVTEYASHHDHTGLRFSHPNGKFFLD